MWIRTQAGSETLSGSIVGVWQKLTLTLLTTYGFLTLFVGDPAMACFTP